MSHRSSRRLRARPTRLKLAPPFGRSILLESLMHGDFQERIAVSEPACASRMGMAKLAKLAFDGGDLRPLRQELIAKLRDGTAEVGEGLDLSLIVQLLGDKDTGLAIQREV